MNKYFLLCIALMMSILSYGQDKVSSYEMSYFRGIYDISYISYPTAYYLYVDAKSLDGIYAEGGISMNESQYLLFIKSLQKAKQAYVMNSLMNKTHKLTRTSLHISSIIDTYYLVDKNWKSKLNTKFVFDFLVIDSTRHLLVIKPSRLSMNKAQNIILTFSNVQEIDMFITALSSRTKFNSGIDSTKIEINTNSVDITKKIDSIK